MSGMPAATRNACTFPPGDCPGLPGQPVALDLQIGGY